MKNKTHFENVTSGLSANDTRLMRILVESLDDDHGDAILGGYLSQKLIRALCSELVLSVAIVREDDDGIAPSRLLLLQQAMFNYYRVA